LILNYLRTRQDDFNDDGDNKFYLPLESNKNTLKTLKETQEQEIKERKRGEFKEFIREV